MCRSMFISYTTMYSTNYFYNHEDNLLMLHVLQTCIIKHCGQIYVYVICHNGSKYYQIHINFGLVSCLWIPTRVNPFLGESFLG